MNKIFIILFLNLIFCNAVYGETNFFKKCKIGPNLEGNFLIDSEKRIIKRVFTNITTKATKVKIDKILYIKGDEVVSEIIQTGTSNRYLQYYLEASTKSVIIQKYKRDDIIGLLAPDGKKERSSCLSVAADWKEKKTEKEIEQEKKEVEFKEKKEKERIKALNKKKEDLKLEEERARNEIKKKRENINKHRILINGDFFPAARPERRVKSENKLKKDFNDKALEVCEITGNFEILEKKIIVVEVGEVSAFPKRGLTAGIQLGITGVVECK
jgi:hypothetical protein